MIDIFLLIEIYLLIISILAVDRISSIIHWNSINMKYSIILNIYINIKFSISWKYSINVSISLFKRNIKEITPQGAWRPLRVQAVHCKLVYFWGVTFFQNMAWIERILLVNQMQLVWLFILSCMEWVMGINMTSFMGLVIREACKTNFR